MSDPLNNYFGRRGTIFFSAMVSTFLARNCKRLTHVVLLSLCDRIRCYAKLVAVVHHPHPTRK
jgi:hypothetical protein